MTGSRVRTPNPEQRDKLRGAMTFEQARTADAIGARIRVTREALGLTQAQLGEATGHPAPVISHFEWGRRRIHAEHLHGIAEALGVPMSHLLGDVEPPMSHTRPRPMPGSAGINAALGRRIRHAREVAGLTEAELATRTGQTADMIIEVERGQEPLSVALLHQIAAVVGCHPVELMLIGEPSHAISDAVVVIGRLLRRSSRGPALNQELPASPEAMRRVATAQKALAQIRGTIDGHEARWWPSRMPGRRLMVSTEALLELHQKGYDKKRIADELGVSQATVSRRLWQLRSGSESPDRRLREGRQA